MDNKKFEKLAQQIGELAKTTQTQPMRIVAALSDQGVISYDEDMKLLEHFCPND